MKNAIIILIISLLALPVATEAQQTRHKSKKHATHKIVKQPVTSMYTTNYSYYDSSRGGYVFMKDGKETFQPSLPVVPDSKPVKKAVPITKGLELDLYPQQSYPANSSAANSH